MITKAVDLSKRAAISLSVLFAFHSGPSTAYAQGTAFTYQGRLNDGAGPANGRYDFRFRLASDPLGNNYLGSSFLTNDIQTAEGLFTVTMDFGQGLYSGSSLWLEIGVRTNGGGGYTTLSPLQAVTATPYAIFAGGASNMLGVVPSGGLSGSYSSTVAFTNTGNVFGGDGSGLTGLSASQLTGGTLPAAALGNAWKTTGNAGTTGGVNFLGTTDGQPFELRVNGLRGLLLQPTINDATHSNAVNIVQGAPVNFVAAGVFAATISGGGAQNYGGVAYTNSVASDIGTVAGGVGNAIDPGSAGSTIGGGSRNRIQAFAPNALIAGGVDNVIRSGAGYSTISGGWLNSVQSNVYYSTAAGGVGHAIGSPYATVSGGGYNSIGTNSNSGTISGGYGHVIRDNSFDGTIGGGSFAAIGTNSAYSTIAGGRYNSIGDSATSSAVGGGLQNTIQVGADYAVIGGGYANAIQTNAHRTTIGGGENNVIQSASDYSVIGGGYSGSVGTNAAYSTIGGGENNQIQARAGSSTIAGGILNTIQTNAAYSTIGGGSGNAIQVGSYSSVIAGGANNVVQSNAYFSYVGSGLRNAIQTNSSYAVIVGGQDNTVQPGSGVSFIGGGAFNQIQPGVGFGVVSGGGGNTIQSNANSSFIGGGQYNSVGTNAIEAAIGGGYCNFCGGNYATVPGGYQNNAVGQNSFAAGAKALASGNGSFVWNSFPNTNYAGNDNEFYVFAENGLSIDYNTQLAGGNGSSWVYIGKGRVGPKINPIFTTIATWTGAYLSDGGTWTSTSDRARKENLAPVDSCSVLERVASLPIQTWNYTNEPPAMRHLGPTAQDFHAAFGLNGEDDQHITDIDEGGVALAAIQGLNQKLIAELKRRDTENAELKRRLEQLEQSVYGQKGN